MIKSVTLWDRMRAAEHAFKPTDYVISITDPGKDLVDIKGTKRILHLSFHDVVPPIPEGFSEMEALNVRLVFDIVTMLHNHQQTYNVIVHCEAGASWSAAIALFVHELSGCNFQHRFAALYANTWMVDLFNLLTHVRVRIPTKREL